VSEPSGNPGTDDDAGAPPDAPKQRRNVWIWVSAATAVIAIGLLVWAVTLRSDLDQTQDDLSGTQQQLSSTNQQLEAAQQDLTSTEQQLDDAEQAPTPAPTPEDDQSRDGTAALVAAGALVTGLARELGATQEDVAAAEQEVTDAQQQAEEAEQEASAAKRQAEDATDEAEKADAQVTQANAERDAAQAKARIAAECGKAYVSAFGGLFGSGNVREQVPAVRKDLQGITTECKTAFAGT